MEKWYCTVWFRVRVCRYVSGAGPSFDVICYLLLCFLLWQLSAAPAGAHLSSLSGCWLGDQRVWRKWVPSVRALYRTVSHCEFVVCVFVAGLIIKRKSGEIPCPLAVEAFAAHLSYICKFDDKYSKYVIVFTEQQLIWDVTTTLSLTWFLAVVSWLHKSGWVHPVYFKQNMDDSALNVRLC